MNVWSRVRKNHALEHGTVALLLKEESAHGLIAGNALPSGFLLYGDIPTELIGKCASAALDQMHHGEHELAVSPFCGTNLVVGAFLATVGALMAVRFSGAGPSGWTRAFSNALLALVLSRPLGRFIQRKYTTSAELYGVSIQGVSRWQFGPVKVHWVATVQEA